MMRAKLNKAKATALAEQEPLPPIPSPPWLERDEAGRPVVTDNGLEAIRLWAARGKTQAAVAAELKIAHRRFESLLGKADTDEPTATRLAWEAGFAQHKSSLIEKLTERAMRGDSICGMFVLKAVHSLRDTGSAVEINNAPHITFTLPAPMSEGDYLKSLGITEPIDVRPIDQRGKSPAEILGVPQLPSPTPTEGKNKNV